MTGWYKPFYAFVLKFWALVYCSIQLVWATIVYYYVNTESIRLSQDRLIHTLTEKTKISHPSLVLYYYYTNKAAILNNIAIMQNSKINNYCMLFYYTWKRKLKHYPETIVLQLRALTTNYSATVAYYCTITQ